MKLTSLCLLAAILMVASFASSLQAQPEPGPVRVLFLGHAGGGVGQSSHKPADMYPILVKGLGRDAIYFDYVTTPEAAFGDAEYLKKFDAVLLYANHEKITLKQWSNLKAFVEGGGGFVPVHCASWCFQNEPEFDKLVGEGRWGQSTFLNFGN